MLYEPTDIPSEWRMWLRKLRDDPPTPEEMSKSEAKTAALRGKVAALEEEERLRRLRQATMGAQARQPGARGPDLSRMLQHMSEDKAGSSTSAAPGEGGAGPQSAPAPPASTASHSRAGSSGGSGFEPHAWKPGS